MRVSVGGLKDQDSSILLSIFSSILLSIFWSPIFMETLNSGALSLGPVEACLLPRKHRRSIRPRRC